MAINKVIVNGTTKLDLTADTVTVDNVQKGFTFHDATGELKTGLANAGGIDGYYIEKVFDSSEIFNSGTRIGVEVTTEGKYCFFCIDNYINSIDIYAWENNSNGYGRTVYVMSTEPITYTHWYVNSSSSSN